MNLFILKPSPIPNMYIYVFFPEIRCERVARLQKVRNPEIRRRMKVDETVFDRIEERHLKW